MDDHTPQNIHTRDLKEIRLRLEQLLPDVQIVDAHRMGGMTNRTYHLFTDSVGELAVRLPGEGTEDMINRHHERISTELATRLGIDTKLIHFDDDGFKVSTYIPSAHTLSAADLRQPETIQSVAQTFKMLHTCGEDTQVPFDVFDMAHHYEDVIDRHDVKRPDDYQAIKDEVFAIKAQTDQETQVTFVPCHNDALCENWVAGEEHLYLIDWEYAGMNDPLWDLADVSIEAAYTPAHDETLLDAYFGAPTPAVWHRRFMANKIYLDYLWTLWGLTRVPFDGAPMQTYADERYARLKESLAQYHATDEASD